MKKILLLTLLALCVPVIVNASVASYSFSGNETEKNEKDVTAPKDVVPTDDDLESLRQELLWEVSGCYVDCSELYDILQWKAGDYIYMDEDAIELYQEIDYYSGVMAELYSHIENASTMEELTSCRQEVYELLSNLTQLREKINAYFPLYFVAVTKEGVEMTFKIISREDKTVQVGTGEWRTCAVPEFTTIGEITIPEEVEGYRVIYIAECAFYGRSDLTSVIIPNSVTSIDGSAFLGCNNLTSVTLNSNDLVSVQENGYFIAGIFGEQVETYIIGDNAFQLCSGMTSVIIGSGVTSIGDGAFSFDCYSLTSIVVESGNTVYDSRDNCNAIVETETNKLVLGCMNTIIPNSVTSIGSLAFSDCIGMTSVTIPDNVTSIGWYAFSDCRGLTSVTIPDNVTNIGDGAFSYCSSMTTVTIGNGVTSIGDRAFCGCYDLKDFYCYATNPPSAYWVYSDGTFYNTPISSATLHVPAGSIDSYKATSPWSGFGNIVPLTDEDGIGEVESSELKVESSIYDLGGRQMVNGKFLDALAPRRDCSRGRSNGQMPRGINIIRMSDGSVRKILRK